MEVVEETVVVDDPMGGGMFGGGFGGMGYGTTVVDYGPGYGGMGFGGMPAMVPGCCCSLI